MGMLSNIGLSIPVFARGVGGIPSVSLVTSLQDQIDSYEHTLSSSFGFESMTCALTVTLEAALDWLNDGLMRSTVVYSPEGEIVWEGICVGVEATFGQERVTVSLDGMANRVRVRYTVRGLGAPGVSSSVSDTISQNLYGIKDTVRELAESDSPTAANFAAALLAELKNPRASMASVVASGDLGGVQLTLTFMGWYGAFDWVLTVNTSTTSTTTTAQVQTLTTAYNAINAFFSTRYNDIVSSGVSAPETIPADTTYRRKLEDLLKIGNSSSQRLAWGVYEDRKWYVNAWAGATPSTIHYLRYLGDASVYTLSGGIVAPWNVRPDRMYQVVELLDPSPTSTAQDAAARKYVERVRCYVSGDSMGCDLEPAASTALDAVFARLAG